jgi:hypothetical protein
MENAEGLKNASGKHHNPDKMTDGFHIIDVFHLSPFLVLRNVINPVWLSVTFAPRLARLKRKRQRRTSFSRYQRRSPHSVRLIPIDS